MEKKITFKKGFKSESPGELIENKMKNCSEVSICSNSNPGLQELKVKY